MMIWTATTEKDEPNLLNLHSKSEADKVQFFNTYWSDLVQTVKNVKIIADKLRQQNIIHEEQYSKITNISLTSQDSMREICSIIRNCSDAVQAKFISILQKAEPSLLEKF